MVPWSSQLNEDFLKKGFAKIDTDGDGFLCDEEINEFIDSAGITITEEDKKEFMEKIMNPKRGELIGKCVYEVSSVKYLATQQTKTNNELM